MTMYVWIKVFGGLFALAYGIYATVVDFHEKRNGQKRLTRKGQIGMTILIVSSSLAILADYGDKKSAAAQKAIEQEAQEKITNEQLSRLGKLADQLAAAQTTTATVSSDMQAALGELKHNAQSVGKVLTQSERALEPLRELTFLGSLKLSASNPEVSALISAARQSLAGAKSSEPLPDGWFRMFESAGPPGFASRLRDPGVLTRYRISKSSSSYPNPGSPLALLASSLLVGVQFHNQMISKPSALSELLKPNLRVEFIATPDDVFNDLGVTPDGLSVLFTFFVTVPFAHWRSDGTILSVRDLLRAQAVIQPIFGAVTDKELGARQIRSEVIVNSFRVSTGDGRWFRFNEHSRLNVDDAPVFVGRFVEHEAVRTQ